MFFLDKTARVYRNVILPRLNVNRWNFNTRSRDVWDM